MNMKVKARLNVLVLMGGFLLMGFAHSALAQQQIQSLQDEKIVVKKSDLTAEQLARVQSQQIKEKLGVYAEYADMGRGVGLAVGESLRAVKDATVDFSKSDVGKFTMFIIAWKVMAKDIIDMGDRVFGYLVGIPFLALSLLLCATSYYRQCVPRRVLVEKGPGFWIWRSKKYEVFDPAGRQDNVGLKNQFFIHGTATVTLIIVGSLMIFSC